MQSCPASLVQRVSVRLIAAVATRIRTFSAKEFATVSHPRCTSASYKRINKERTQQRRFRRDPDGYLLNWNLCFLQLALPTLVFWGYPPAGGFDDILPSKSLLPWVFLLLALVLKFSGLFHMASAYSILCPPVVPDPTVQGFHGLVLAAGFFPSLLSMPPDPTMLALLIDLSLVLLPSASTQVLSS